MKPLFVPAFTDEDIEAEEWREQHHWGFRSGDFGWWLEMCAKSDRRDAELMLWAAETRRDFGPGAFCVENSDCSDFTDCGGSVSGSRLWCLPRAT